MNIRTSSSFAKASQNLKEIKALMSILQKCDFPNEPFDENSKKKVKDFEGCLYQAKYCLEVMCEQAVILFSDAGVTDVEICSKLEMKLERVTEIIEREQNKRKRDSEFESAKNAVPAEIAKLNLREAGFSTRLRNLLSGECCYTVLDVALMTQERVDKIPYMGKTLRNELMTFMVSRNLQFRPNN